MVVSALLKHEGQFRCLKHAHILLLRTDSLGLSDIDNIIQAQLPEKDLDPELFEAVCNYMLHGPCGAANPNAPCMKNGVCAKGWLLDFVRLIT